MREINYTDHQARQDETSLGRTSQNQAPHDQAPHRQVPDDEIPRDDGRQETPLERLDRNLEEMTGELRVVVTGVQVLFAFLLIVPFDSGFAGIGPYERAIYFVTLLLAALSAVCTIAPSAHHRFLFRHDDKHHLVFFANRVVIAGLGFLALAMCGALMLVATKLFGDVAGVVTAACAAAVFALIWFIPPLLRRAAIDSSPPSAPARASRELVGARDPR
jgi:hypothetical protein